MFDDILDQSSYIDDSEEEYYNEGLHLVEEDDELDFIDENSCGDESLDVSRFDINSQVIDVLDLNSLDISIDNDKETIEIYDGDTSVGIIFKGEFSFGDTNTTEHLGIEINYDYRRNGIGKYLYNLYEENFGLPEFDYTRKVDKLNFFISIGYTPISLINNSTGEEEEFYGDSSDFDKIEEGYVCKVMKSD